MFGNGNGRTDDAALGDGMSSAYEREIVEGKGEGVASPQAKGSLPGPTFPAARAPFPCDAALEQPAEGTYATRRQPFAEALRLWRDAIAREQLADLPVSSLHGIAIDPRDGALLGSKGSGLAYTPHAWHQLVGLMQARGPAGMANVMRWQSPRTRAEGWRDVVARSERARKDNAVVRAFTVYVNGLAVRAARAIVSGRHAGPFFDDLNVGNVIANLAETPSEGRVYRGQNYTFADFVLATGDADVRLGFAVRNSETGMASLSFSGSLLIKALDVVIVAADGSERATTVQIANARGATRRRHTLPRYAATRGTYRRASGAFDSDGYQRLSTSARAAIAARRINEDIATALQASRTLAQRWAICREQINPALVPLAKASEATDAAVPVLMDALADLGIAYGKDADERRAFARSLAKVMAEDSRLKSLPHGSAAHLAASLAVLASSDKRTWEAAREIQSMAGDVLERGFGG